MSVCTSWRRVHVTEGEAVLHDALQCGVQSTRLLRPLRRVAADQVHELHDQVAVARARLAGVRGHRVEEPVQALGRADLRLADVLDLEHQLLDARVGDLAQHVELGGVVVEEGLLGDVGAFADVGDPCLVVALLREELARGLEDPGAHLQLAPLPAREPLRRRGGFRQRIRALGGAGRGHGRKCRKYV